MPDTPLRVRDLLIPAQLLARIAARSIPEAAALLVERLVQTGAAQAAEPLRERFEDARTEDLVLVGARAVLLHYRTDAATRVALALATLAQPIGGGEEERQAAVDVVAMVISPRRLAARHLRLVRALERVLDAPAALAALHAAPTGEALAAVPALADIALPAGLSVGDVMTVSPRSIEQQRTVAEAIEQLRQAGVAELPVVDADRRVLGVFGERELLRVVTTRYLTAAEGPPRAAPARSDALVPVREVMTRQVWCVAPGQPLAEVAALMLHRDIARVSVVDGGRLVGFLTRGDVARRLLDR